MSSTIMRRCSTSVRASRRLTSRACIGVSESSCRQRNCARAELRHRSASFRAGHRVNLASSPSRAGIVARRRCLLVSSCVDFVDAHEPHEPSVTQHEFVLVLGSSGSLLQYRECACMRIVLPYSASFHARSHADVARAHELNGCFLLDSI